MPETLLLWRVRYPVDTDEGFPWRYGYVAAPGLEEARTLAVAHVAELADPEEVRVTPMRSPVVIP